MEDLSHTQGNLGPCQSRTGRQKAPILGTSISPKFLEMHFWRLFRVIKIFLTKKSCDFFFLVFLGLQPWRMEVPRPGVELEL